MDMIHLARECSRRARLQPQFTHLGGSRLPPRQVVVPATQLLQSMFNGDTLVSTVDQQFASKA
jgi:hypothetical protein